MKEITAAVLLLFFAATVWAGDCDSVRPDLLIHAREMAQNSRDAEIKEFSVSSAGTLEGSSSGGQETSSNCLEKYKNVTIGSAIGLPSLSDLSKKIFDQVSSEACSSVDSIYNQATDAMGQTIMLPGNLGAAKVSPLAAPTSYPQQQQPAIQVQPSQGTQTTVPNYIKGIFQ